MTKPQFHIVTPSYNQAHYIRETLRSVLSQKGVKVKLWVMDGGSSDGTVDILEKFGQKITWTSKKDKGQSDALNQGLKKILREVPREHYHSTYISYLNSDDFLQADALQAVAKLFHANPNMKWLVGECQIVDDKNQPIQESIKVYKMLWRKLLSWPILLILNPIPQPAVFWRLSSTAEIGLFNQQLHYTMDYEYWLRLWRAFGPPLITASTLAAFRIHGASKGSTSYIPQFNEQHQVARTFTQSNSLLFFQRLHNQLIFFCYNLLKS